VGSRTGTAAAIKYAQDACHIAKAVAITVFAFPRYHIPAKGYDKIKRKFMLHDAYPISS
jgi:hypothetical protein